MLGYAQGEMDAAVEKWGEYIHPDDLIKAKASIDQHFAGQSPVHEVEVRFRTKAGEWRWMLTRGRIVEREADGRPAMMSGTFTDIMARKETERVLHQAAIVFENTREGVVITDAEARILSVNRAFTLISGYTPDEVRGKVPTLMLPGAAAHQLLQRHPRPAARQRLLAGRAVGAGARTARPTRS